MRTHVFLSNLVFCAAAALPCYGAITYETGSISVSSNGAAQSSNPDIRPVSAMGPTIRFEVNTSDFPLSQASPFEAETTDGAILNASSSFSGTLAIDESAGTMTAGFQGLTNATGMGEASLQARLLITFSVTQPSVVQVTGTYEVSAIGENAAATVGTYDAHREVYRSFGTPETGTFSGGTAVNGTNTIDMRTDLTGLGTAEMNITVRVFPASEVFWSTNDGDWEIEENWEPQQVPGAEQTVVFDRDAQYTVTIGTTSTGRAIVERGTVTWAGDLLELRGGNEPNPSLVVGNNSADLAQLNLSLASLRTEYTSIGHNQNTTGTVSLSGNTGWANAETLIVGREGLGGLSIEDTSIMTTGELRIAESSASVGFLSATSPATPLPKQSSARLISGPTSVGISGSGELTVDRLLMVTGDTRLGVNAGGAGRVNMEEDFTLQGRWRLEGPLIIGDSGAGTVEAGAGNFIFDAEGQMQSVTVANAQGSVGTLRLVLASLSIDGDVRVGPGGNGMFMIEGIGLTGVDARALFIGPSQSVESGTPRGDAFIQGDGFVPAESDVEFTTNILVGGSGVGNLFLMDGTYVSTEIAGIGTNEGGVGLVTVDNARLDAHSLLAIGLENSESPIPLGFGNLTLINGHVSTFELVLDRGSIINGVGVIDADNSAINGTVAGGGTPPKLDPASVPEHREHQRKMSFTKQDSPIGTLRFEGDVVFDGATIAIDISSQSDFDVVEITGDADLTNTTINFVFLEGYLPQTGDELPFLSAANIAMDANTTTTYTGAAGGFQFDLMDVNGTLMFQAQSDAQPEGAEGEGEAEGNGEGGGGCPAGAGTSGRIFGGVSGDSLLCGLALLALAIGRRRFGRGATREIMH